MENATSMSAQDNYDLTRKITAIFDHIGLPPSGNNPRERGAILSITVDEGKVASFIYCIDISDPLGYWYQIE